MAHALRAALPDDPLWADPLVATEGAVDVKEALKRAVTGQLEVRASGVPSHGGETYLGLHVLTHGPSPRVTW